ncbi:hypothetical protein [Stenotrophomonas sp. Iso1]|uniref:lipopolysaccharide biosynthesis protein n=1 Tax=Stenotrophomonas sp. Iso1 TaxID=2977283 RepID=UPI0022B7AB50|nr:hypothetical protein [Stenotrophomonas sp. Iso1]
MKFLIPIISRYSSILVQFILITLIARTLPSHDAGAYFAISGVVLSIYFIAGLGIPDGLVAACPSAAAVGRSDTIRGMVIKGLAYSCALSIIVPICTFIIVLTFLKEADSAFHAAIWSAGYSLTFIASQTLVAMKKVQWGSFIFYSAINACICFSTIPYLLFAASPNLQSALAINAFAALFAGTAALVLTVSQASKLERSPSPASLTALWKNGVLISAGRVVQAAILWTPVWIASVLLTHSDAAELGLAGRLLSIVGALLAAIRFSVRPTLAFLAVKKDWQAVEKISGEVAFVASTFTLTAMGATWLFGEDAIALVYGQDYSAVTALLLIMLGAILAESLSGTVDEALKMSMHSAVALASQVTALALVVVLGVVLASRYGAPGAAFASVVAFIVMYGIQILGLFRLYGIIVLPKIPHRKP